MAPTGPSFTCPDCGMVSYNPYDVLHAYCGQCHEFKSITVVDVATRKLAMSMVNQYEFRSTIRGQGTSQMSNLLPAIREAIKERDPYAFDEHSNFVPREELVASGVFVRAKINAGVKLPMYISYNNHGIICYFVGIIGTKEYKMSVAASRVDLKNSKNVGYEIEYLMRKSWLEFLNKVDHWDIVSWLNMIPFGQTRELR